MHRFLLVSLLLTLGCTSQVELTKSGRGIEKLSHNYLRQERAGQCTEIDRFEVVVRANERSKGSVAETKARNEAARGGKSTHVLLWPSNSFACDRDGNPVEAEGKDTCEKIPVTGYSCVMGAGS